MTEKNKTIRKSKKPPKYKRATYARLIGEIAIEWNFFERNLKSLGFGYLRGDPEVASHIFGGMGNISLVEFIDFLCEKNETEKTVKEAVHFVTKSFNILRENRNILEHATPDMDRLGYYKGSAQKSDKRGKAKPFAASIDALKETLESIENARGYARCVSLVTHRHTFDDKERINGGPTEREAVVKALSCLERPPLPRKIDPLPPPSVTQGDNAPLPPSHQSPKPRRRSPP